MIITENQLDLIRRYNQLKELVDEGIDVLNNQDDVCDYTLGEFVEEVCWQVSDNKKFLNMDDINKIHEWVKDNFYIHIKDEFNKITKEHDCGNFWNDADDIMESKGDKYEDTFKRRTHFINDFIDSLNPEDICKYWKNEPEIMYVDDNVVGIVWELMDSCGIRTSHENTKKYFHIFNSLLEKYGYVDKIRNIYRKEIKKCKK